MLKWSILTEPGESAFTEASLRLVKRRLRIICAPGYFIASPLETHGDKNRDEEEEEKQREHDTPVYDCGQVAVIVVDEFRLSRALFRSALIVRS